MSRPLYWLDDAQWQRLEPLLPKGRRGARRVDDHRVISGIIQMLQSGARWRDCPAEYGPYTTVYNRFNRRRKRGAFTQAIGRSRGGRTTTHESSQPGRERAARALCRWGCLGSTRTQI